MNPQRLAVINKIDDLIDRKCKSCKNYGNRKNMHHCTPCPVNKQLLALGDKLNKISRGKQKMTKVQKKVFSKETYQLMAETKTDTEIAREFGIKQPTLAYHKKKWFGGKQDAEKILQPDQEYQKLMGELKVQLDKKKVTVEQLEDKIHQLTETVTAKNQRVSELERENARLKADVEKLQDDIENIECLHGAESLEQEHIAKVAETYKNELEQQVKQNQELRNRIRSTVKELAQYI